MVRPRSYRPLVELLENRSLLSAGFAVVNLAADLPGLAPVVDSNLVNPWGVAFSPTGPFWLADNGSGVSDIVDGRGEASSLVVRVPATSESTSAPTGVVFNAGPGFVISEHGRSAPSRFLFASTDGVISGWSAVVDTTHGLVAVDNSSSGAMYTGLALATDSAGHSLLYAADFGRGAVDMFDADFHPVVRRGAFQDPDLPDGFAPFNVQNVNGVLFVTYAQRDDSGLDDDRSAGNGVIDVFDADGALLRRFASQGALNAPWGIAVAPSDFAPFGGALLVANNGDGRITAYDGASGAALGQLADDAGVPLSIPELWALTFGNGHAGGAAGTLFFTAGIGAEKHGLFGAIQSPARRGTDTAGPLPFDQHAPGEPGDYPLPPPGGPALSRPHEGQPIAVAELLPLRESSLALAPTLLAAQPPRGIEVPTIAASGLGVSSAGGTLNASATPAAVAAPADDFNTPPSAVAPRDALALTSFLDLYAPSDTSETRARSRRHTVTARTYSPGQSLREEASTALNHGPQVQDAQSAARAGQSLDWGLAPDQASTASQAATLEDIDAKLSNERGVGDRGAAAPARDHFITVLTVLFVASIPLGWTYSTRDRQA